MEVDGGEAAVISDIESSSAPLVPESPSIVATDAPMPADSSKGDGEYDAFAAGGHEEASSVASSVGQPQAAVDGSVEVEGALVASSALGGEPDS